MERMCWIVEAVFQVEAIRVWPVPEWVRVRERWTGWKFGSER